MAFSATAIASQAGKLAQVNAGGTDFDYVNPLNWYRTILTAGGSHIAAKVAGTYALGFGDILAVTGTGTLFPFAYAAGGGSAYSQAQVALKALPLFPGLVDA